MWMLVGGPALTPNRTERLQRRLERHAPGLGVVAARWLYFVDGLPEEHDAGAHERLHTLLDASPARSADVWSAVVVPRPGVRSSWSTKATEILHHCGAPIRRVERGVGYQLHGALPEEGKARVFGELFDRMTEALLPKPEAAVVLFHTEAPRPLARIPGDYESLIEANRQMGLALTDLQLRSIEASFVLLGRAPHDIELMMYAQANSEHCRHHIFNASYRLDGVAQDRSLFSMIRHTYQVTAPRRQAHPYAPGAVLSAYADNAAVIAGYEVSRFFPDQTRRWSAHYEPAHLLMKVETHNHPTGIAPWPGAATGAGGEIRDEGATGRGARPRAGLCGFSVSDLHLPGGERPWEAAVGTSPRMADALAIMTEGPLGAAAFNNEFGRPNLCGYFRSFCLSVLGPAGRQWRGYHKPIMIAGGYGHVRPGHVDKAPVPAGAALVVLGGPAMLIGLGGGAASSVGTGELAHSDLDFASVQRANAEMQRRAQEVIDRCWALGDQNPIRSIHDVGAGGLSNALPELVHGAGRGGQMELRDIPSDEPGMSPMELWCNEAQERYVLAIAAEDLPRFAAICERERAVWACVGHAVEEARLELTDRELGDTPIQLPMAVLFGREAPWSRDACTSPPATDDPAALRPVLDLRDALYRVLKLPTVASKEFLITIGDRSVTGTVVRDQMVGPWQVPVADCAVTVTDYDGYTGETMAMGERGPVALLSGGASARLAVAEALTNLVAADVGGLESVVLSANWMCAAGDPIEEGRLLEAVQAVAIALCPTLGVVIPVGKDSMSMRASWRDANGEHRVVAPMTVVISAFSPVVDVRRTLTPQLRPGGALIHVDLSGFRGRLGGSALMQVQGRIGDTPADLDDPTKMVALWAWMARWRDRLWAWHDVSDGGLVVTVLEMAFAGHCGVTLRLSGAPNQALFAEEPGGVLEVAPEDLGSALADLAAAGLPAQSIGEATTEGVVRIRGADGAVWIEEDRVDLERAWAEPGHLISRERDDAALADQAYDRLLDRGDPGITPKFSFDPSQPEAPAAARRPRVAILREQGVNGHAEMAAAFSRAGFDAIDVTMSDVLSGRDTLDAYVGLAACGGFSYGDVLGAGGGWARSILFNDRARSVFAGFFARPETFSLGVCNGCQMMSQLRELIPSASLWPRFEGNRSGRFEARVATVRIEEGPSIFFRGMSGAELPVAVAHGEGRVVYHGSERPPAAARFVDHRGAPTELYPLNPNGSPDGATAFSSADGRATVLMPHPERVFRAVANSYRPEGWGEDGPWMRMFRNARAWVG